MSHSITKRTSEARSMMEMYKKLEKINETLYWRRGEAIYKLKKDNLWKFAYGEDGSTWGNFCFNELKMPLSTADQKIATYEFFIVKHKFTVKQLSEYNTISLYYISRYKSDETKKQLEGFMADSLVIPRKDFLDVLRGKDCAHHNTHEVDEKRVVCDGCSRVVRKIKPKKK